VIVALPEAVPAQYASETAVTLKFVVVAGLTKRAAGLVVMLFCVTPSDHVTLHGAVPESAARISEDWPEQMVALPLTVAVGHVTVSVTGTEVCEPQLLLTTTSYVSAMLVGVIETVNEPLLPVNATAL
jgi:hypothetical protein